MLKVIMVEFQLELNLSMKILMMKLTMNMKDGEAWSSLRFTFVYYAFGSVLEANYA